MSPELLSHFLARDPRAARAADWSASSPDGMVATAHFLATRAGAETLAAGGNAIDAAIAASLALGACEPAASGLGGMAMMVLHLGPEGRTLVLPGPCRAPAAATPELLSKSRRYRGRRAVAVPALLSVLSAARERFGTLSEAALLAPAIGLAEDGVPMTPTLRHIVEDNVRVFRSRELRAVFVDDAGLPRAVGTTLRQPALARTLRRLAEAGFEDFYRGGIARDIDADMRRHDGFLRLADLEALAPPSETEPLRASFRGKTACVAGPPAGGLALAQVLRLLDALGERALDPDSPVGALAMARAIRRARRDRKRYRLEVGAEELGQGADLLEDSRVRAAAERIDEELGAGETSHVVVADREGNVVSMTQSIERSFGAAVAAPALGFVYNGFLRAFKVKNRRHPHFVAAGRAARSNAAPTILLEGSRAVAAIGNTGSERLASGIAQVLARLEFMSPFEASLAPRFHATPDDVIHAELERISPEVAEAWRASGSELAPLDSYSFKTGGLNLLVRRGNEWTGVGEPRRDGAAAGPEGLER